MKLQSHHTKRVDKRNVVMAHRDGTISFRIDGRWTQALRVSRVPPVPQPQELLVVQVCRLRRGDRRPANAMFAPRAWLLRQEPGKLGTNKHTNMSKLPNERANRSEAERRAARRKEYRISLHASFNDKHPALPHMTPLETEHYLAAAAALSQAKKKREALIARPVAVPRRAPLDPQTQEILDNFHPERREALQQMPPGELEQYIELSARMEEAVEEIAQIVAAVIDRLTEKH
jgi:hypothetical protein